MALVTTPWNVQDFLQTPEDCAAYVQAALDEAGDDAAFVVKALGDVARSRGMAALARDVGVTREGLYRSISESGNPSFSTVFRLIRALGLEVKVSAAAPV
jgi:probable addiction module antidote protein